ncbi:hypothetical protein G797_04395 [Escherichia coli HVH 139 (4-3192644)]|uniref:DUF6862 domain-containing protein n=1 Tax=Escherichia coli TaxID=562 RepID=UPI000391813E|nr:hypothetical protein [Escherichia coli]EQR90539.1 hypothetical protein G797_04395 [Escherichia coli HVH 139 (4-3192644)]
MLEKDISSDKAVIAACSNGQAASAACAGERLKVIAAKGGYETGNYNNQVSDMYPDAYGQIVNLLNITSVDAQNQQQVKDAMVSYAMTQFGVDKATAESYVETYDGMKTVAASMTPLLGAAAVSKIDSIVANYSKANQLSTGTVFDSIKATQPVHPGSVIPQSFEMSLPNGQKIWVHGNATEHMAEYAASKAVTHTPEAVRLASQVELSSFQAAVNTATKTNMPYGERITVDSWQLEIKPPCVDGELPTIIHARYLGSH